MTKNETKNAPQPRKSRRRKSFPAASEVVAPGGGTRADIELLSSNLGLPGAAVSDIMNCQGAGVVAANKNNAGSSKAATVDGTHAWADFMQDEGFTSPSSAVSMPAVPDAKRPKSNDGTAHPAQAPTPTPASTEAESNSTGTISTKQQSMATLTYDPAVREYRLPVPPLMRLHDDKKGGTEEDTSNHKNGLDPYEPPRPGMLAQTGTLDVTVVGRRTLTNAEIELHAWHLAKPTMLGVDSIFNNNSIKISLVASSSSSCHSVAIDVRGDAYVWGRNDKCQLGLLGGLPTTCVPFPQKVTTKCLPKGNSGDDDEIDNGRYRFVGAATGRSHTILVDRNGDAYATGSNKYGQCGVNTSTVESIPSFRKCVIGNGGKKRGRKDGGNSGGGDTSAYDDDDANSDQVKIVQASCGDQFSVILTDRGHLYTCGLAEFGQLGNGETGEHFIAGNKLVFANAMKFERRSIFVQSHEDAEAFAIIVAAAAGESSRAPPPPREESKKDLMSVLSDSARITLASVSCGRNHTVVVEAPPPKVAGVQRHLPRVFSWGCGSYGCLGHGQQKDEYRPRLVSIFRSPIFASNPPVRVSLGTTCSLALSSNGHVYYWGKHKSSGEATMNPTVVDVLSNNGHIVTTLGSGNQTVFCSTSNGATVSWGNGPNGELGYGGMSFSETTKRGSFGGKETVSALGPKSSSKPKFVEGLDECMITAVSCGYGHTLCIVREDDEEDRKALKKIPKLEEEDMTDFVPLGGFEIGSAGGNLTKKKGRSKKK